MGKPEIPHRLCTWSIHHEVHPEQNRTVQDIACVPLEDQAHASNSVPWSCRKLSYHHITQQRETADVDHFRRCNCNSQLNISPAAQSTHQHHSSRDPGADLLQVRRVSGGCIDTQRGNVPKPLAFFPSQILLGIVFLVPWNRTRWLTSPLFFAAICIFVERNSCHRYLFWTRSILTIVLLPLKLRALQYIQKNNNFGKNAPRGTDPSGTL